MCFYSGKFLFVGAVLMLLSVYPPPDVPLKTPPYWGWLASSADPPRHGKNKDVVYLVQNKWEANNGFSFLTCFVDTKRSDGNKFVFESSLLSVHELVLERVREWESQMSVRAGYNGKWEGTGGIKKKDLFI